MGLFEDQLGDLDDLLEKLGAPDAAARRVALAELADLGDNTAVPSIVAALKDDDAGVREDRGACARRL